MFFFADEYLGVVFLYCRFFSAHEYLGVAYDAVQAVDENGKPKDAGAGLEGMGLVCVWKVPDEPAEPKFLLAAHVSPTSHVLVPLATEMLCVGNFFFQKSAGSAFIEYMQ